MNDVEEEFELRIKGVKEKGVEEVYDQFQIPNLLTGYQPLFLSKPTNDLEVSSLKTSKTYILRFSWNIGDTFRVF